VDITWWAKRSHKTKPEKYNPGTYTHRSTWLLEREIEAWWIIILSFIDAVKYILIHVPV
jgi:hypothetical protein